MEFIRHYLNDQFHSRAGVCSIKNAAVGLSVALDQQIVAAVTGQSIRVISAVIQSQNTASTLMFKSGGTPCSWVFSCPAITSAPSIIILPHNPYGWFETTAGYGLFADVTGSATGVTIRYITYVP